MRYIYSVIVFFFLPIIFFKLWRGAKNIATAQNRWQERIGFLPKSNLDSGPSTSNHYSKKPVLWIHTASVGEFIAARPLIDHYLKTEEWKLCITTMTATGSAEVLKQYGHKVTHVFAPCDLGICIRRFLKEIQPQAYLIVETELWPNTIHHCKKKDIPVIVVNARLSEKSAKGYKIFHKLSHKMLDDISHVIAQDTKDAQRFYDLGLRENKCSISGSIKFDLTITAQTQQQAIALKNDLSESNTFTLLIAASTHDGEDEHILNAFRALKNSHEKVRLILVPRHPERFESVFKLSQKMGFLVARRSEISDQTTAQKNSKSPSESNFSLCINSVPKETDILLGDTMGELLTMLGAADIAFIGGSFIDNGGHNYIEAAAWGIPIISGPSRFNFLHISDLLIAEQALTIVETPEDLLEQWKILIDDKTLRQTRGQASKKVAENNRGALNKTIDTITQVLNF